MLTSYNTVSPLGKDTIKVHLHRPVHVEYIANSRCINLVISLINKGSHTKICHLLWNVYTMLHAITIVSKKKGR